MNSKKLFLGVSTVLLCGLFLIKLTGVMIHIVLGILLFVILLLHCFKQRKHIDRIKIAWKRVSRILLFLVGLIVLSGLLIRWETISLYAFMIHKIASLLFIVFISIHIKQHILYKKNKKFFD